MTEIDARREGLRFTGSYAFDKEEVKLKAKAIRDLGFRAIVVNVPGSKYSRGGPRMGYSVYAEPAYETFTSWKRNVELYKQGPARVAALKEKHEQELKDLQDHLSEYARIALEQYATLRGDGFNPEEIA